MKVLITGASGFLGKNISPLLHRHYNVIEIGGHTTYDLRDQSQVKEIFSTYKPDVVVHAAGRVGGIGANRENPGKFMYDNLSMGINVIEECRLSECQKIIMLGTVCAYPKFTPVPFKESEIWEGYPEETNAPYGIAKKTLMELVMAYHQQYGLKGANLVPVNMYGPHDHFNLTSSHVIPALILKVHNAIKNNDSRIIGWGTGSASREFLYAEDCGEAIRLAIETDIEPSFINIGTGCEIKIKDLLEKICDIMGFEGEIEWDTSKPDGQPRRCLDVSKAEDLLGFKASVGFEEGLERTIKWFKAHPVY